MRLFKKYTYLVSSYARTKINFLAAYLKARWCDVFGYSRRCLYSKKLGVSVVYPRWRAVVPYKFSSVMVDIGSGHGEIVEYLSRDTKNLVIGFEIRSRYFKKTLNKVKDRSNAFVFKDNGYEKIFWLFRPSSVSRIIVMFPDPWPKARHAKRRILKTSWLSRATLLLKLTGDILIATDHKEYFTEIKDSALFLARQNSGLKVETGRYEPSRFGLVPTHYYTKMGGGDFVRIVRTG